MVDDITNHVGPLPILDQPKCITTELKVIPSLIDTVRPVAFDIDASLDIGEQLVEGRGAWLKSNVGNTHDRDAAPAVCTIGSARACLADFRRDLAVRTIADEDPVAHNVPLLAGHAIVVVAGGSEGLRFAVIGDEIDVRGAVSEGSSCVGRKKAGAGIVGLIPQRTIELARMAAGFVHGERQMFRVEDEIILSGFCGRRLHLLDGFRCDAWGYGEEIGVVDQFIAHPKMRCVETP